MSNYLRPVSVVLAVLILISSVLAWYFLARVLENPIESYYQLIWPTVLFIVLAGLAGLSFFTVESKLFGFVFSLLALAPFFAFFDFNRYYVPVFAFFLLVFLRAQQKIKREKGLLIKLNLKRPLAGGFGIIFVVLFFIVSAAYYFSPNVQALTREELKLPKSIFALVMPFAGNFLQGQIPGFSPEKTVDEILNEMLTQQLGELPKGISPALLEKEKQKFLAEQKAEIAKQFGVELKENQTLGDLFYDFSNKQLNQYAGNYKIFIPAILSSGLFFTLFTFLIPFKWLAGLFAFLLFQLLLASGLILKSTVKTDKEVLNI